MLIHLALINLLAKSWGKYSYLNWEGALSNLKKHVISHDKSVISGTQVHQTNAISYKSNLIRGPACVPCHLPSGISDFWSLKNLSRGSTWVPRSSQNFIFWTNLASFVWVPLVPFWNNSACINVSFLVLQWRSFNANFTCVHVVSDSPTCKSKSKKWNWSHIIWIWICWIQNQTNKDIEAIGCSSKRIMTRWGDGILRC